MKSARSPRVKPSSKAPTDIAGDALYSAQAFANLTALCWAHQLNRREIECMDVVKDPKRALADGIFMTPTLVKLAPLPARSVIGMPSQTQTALQAWGLDIPAA